LRSSNRAKTITLILMGTIQLLSVYYYFMYFADNGYLPSPFVFDKSDSFMDLFHPMWWASNEGRYTEWASVYPPLNFILLNIVKWISLGGASFSDSFALRDAGYSIKVIFIFLYLLTPIIVLKTSPWESFSVGQKALTYLVVILSTPMLFALERGNLVIFTLIFLALTLSNSGMRKSVSIAILINLKPYFALLLIHYAIKRRWDDLLTCTLISGGIYLIAGLALDVNFLLFIENTIHFSKNEALFSLREVMSMPSSVSSFSYVLSSDALKVSPRYYILNADTLATTIEVTKWLIIVTMLLALIYAHKHLSDNQIIAALVVIITNLGIWVGGYSLIFYVALIPIFQTMKLRSIYYGILLLIFMPLDFFTLIERSEFIAANYSYLSDSWVQVEWTLGFGSISKPALNLLLLTVLLYEVVFESRHRENANLPLLNAEGNSTQRKQ
jgi:hypothetical protein